MKTLLFLTGGPYFWPHQKATTTKYEMLSKHATGFILSFVCSKDWRRVQIGKFQLIGFYCSDAAYNILAWRTLARIVFTLGMVTYIHYFKKRVDVIITWDPFFTGMLGYVASKLTGAKLIVEVNGEYASPDNWEMQRFNVLTYLKFQYVRRMVPFILNHAHGIKLLYQSQLNGFRGLTRLERYRSFHDLVPISLYHRRPGSKKYVLFIGQPWHRKGVDVLIKAFNEISKDFPDWTLKFVGYLPEKERFKSLYEHNKEIHFVGPVMPEKVPELMSECSLFVLPSRSEGMPRVIIEAMAAGKPVIASRISGIPYYLKHEKTAMLFDSEDVRGLAQTMSRVMSDKNLASQLGENAYRYAWASLSEHSHVNQFMQMIDDVTKGNQKGFGLENPYSDHPIASDRKGLL